MNWLGEAIRRLRAGTVHRTAGYDGEYGVIRLFEPGELPRTTRGARQSTEALFDLPAIPVAPVTSEKRTLSPGRPKVPSARRSPESAQSQVEGRGVRETADAGDATATPRAAHGVPEEGETASVPAGVFAVSPHQPWEPMLAGMEEVGTGLLDRLDALQRVAASAPGGPLLVVAGPGTGKTRTLTHRIAYLCADLGVRPDQCLAITFTRRAAAEMRERLAGLLGSDAERVTVATFHALGLQIVRENADAAGLTPGFGIADDEQREAVRAAAGEDPESVRKLLREQNLIDVDELITVPLELFAGDPRLADRYQMRWPWVFVDEYQDVDADQYDLLRALVPTDGNICAIGDPDQAIYSFRGADVGYFLRFAEDFAEARTVRLARNYRSTAPIIAVAAQVIAPGTLVRGRRLDPARVDPDDPLVAVHCAQTQAAEADWVAKAIDSLVGGVSHRSFDGGRVDPRTAPITAVAFTDIAVLYRTDAQAAAVVDALTRAGIPVQKRAHDRLRSRRAVREIAREVRFATSLEAGATVVDRVRAAARRLASGAPPLFAVEPAAPVLNEAEIFTAVELVVPLATTCGTDLEAFCQALATDLEADAMDPKTQAVHLVTLHASKGLEWPVVFIIGCEDGLVPLRFPGTPAARTDGDPARDDLDSVAEERRLFFVGVTRAQRQLFLTHSVRRPRTPFLDPVDPALLATLDPAPRPTSQSRHRQLRLI